MAVESTLGRRLPTYASGGRSTGWWGIVLLVMIEIMVFSSLIVSYFYLYSSAPEWPLGEIEPPKLLLPSINALILFGSAFVAWLGDRAIARDNLNGLKLWRAIASVMLVVFLILKYVEYSGLNYRWDTNAYSSIVWTITGFHSAHVLVVLLKTLATQVLAWKGFWSAERRSAVQGTTLYWIFVALVWVPLFSTLYLFPHLI